VEELCEHTIKQEELLEANLEAMYKVTMSICDLLLNDQVCNNKSYEDINERQDMKLSRRLCTQMEMMTPIWDTIMLLL